MGLILNCSVSKYCLFLNSCTFCVTLLLQSGCRSSAVGVYVAEAPYRHEELAVMAVPDERLHTDTLLEHHHGERQHFHAKKKKRKPLRGVMSGVKELVTVALCCTLITSQLIQLALSAVFVPLALLAYNHQLSHLHVESCVQTI